MSGTFFKTFKIFTALAVLFFLSSPAIVLAGSCYCKYQGIVQGSSVEKTSACIRDKNSADECKATDSKYFNCTLFSDNDCVTLEIPPAPKTTEAKEELKLINPYLEIKIPGLNFTQVAGSVDEEGNFYAPWLAEYLAALYKFAMAAASVIAVVMIVVQGARVVVSGGGQEKIAAYKRIGQVVVGLLILWGSYIILYTINPNLVTFKSLTVKQVPWEPLPVEYFAEPNSISGGLAPLNPSSVTGDNLVANNGVTVSEDIKSKLITAAANLKPQGIQLWIASGLRTLAEQKALIAKHCTNPSDYKTCDPPTCLLVNNDPKNCPHTTGRAVDAWGRKLGTDGQWRQCMIKDKCSTNPVTDPCHADPCQAAVIAAMRGAGFCNWPREAWHFESPPMSPGCN